MFAILFAFALAYLPACQYEDSTDCGWDATAQGNGTGSSFVALDTQAGTLLIYSDGSTVTY